MRAARDFSAKMSRSLKVIAFIYAYSPLSVKFLADHLFTSMQIEVFPYAVFYMFFEQYLNIWKTALINLAIAIG